jgi:hypothetical protein
MADPPIVAIGLDVDPTFAGFVDKALDADVVLHAVNLRAAVDGEWQFELPIRCPARLHYGDVTAELRPESAFYCRIIDMSWSHPDDTSARARWQALTGSLQTWLDGVPGLVVNRWRGGIHNGSKPLHEAVLCEFGFNVPESITTSDLGEILAFVRRGPAISKPICGVRADAIIVTEDDFTGFEPTAGPVHLQRVVTGTDARIHVIGKEIVAQRVRADATDYRRAGAIGDMLLFDPPPELQKLMVEGTRGIGLEFAGWDFKIDDDGVFWCLEANPMPGYSPYDDCCEGAISRALFRHLAAGSRFA